MTLKQRHGAAQNPFNVLSLDSEDSNGKTYTWAVCGHYNGSVVDKVFDAAADVVKFLFQKRWQHTVLVGSNLDYDLNTLKYRGGFEWRCIYNMGHLITAYPREQDVTKFKLQNKGIKIIEIGNWVLNRSLKMMCADFGIAGHIDRHVLGRDGNKKQMIEACRSHARTGAAVFDYIQKQLIKLGGRVKLTASASALDFFQLKFLKKEHEIHDFRGTEPNTFGLDYDEDDEALIEEARLEYIKQIKRDMGRAYVGGRAEAFNLGLYNDIDAIDINSSYPHEMKNKIFPDVNTLKKIHPTRTDLIWLLDNYEGAAYVKVFSPERRIPFLHLKHNGKLVFPTGVFSNWYTFPELKIALKNGYKILGVGEALIFKGIKNLFAEYIEHLYTLKENPHTKFIAKLLMNGLSGKFGQQVPDDSGFVIVEDLEGVEVDDKQYFVFGDLIYEYVPRDNTEPIDYVKSAYPILSAYVTAYARIHLWETMQAIGEKYVKYCDTDSIHADSAAVQAAVRAGKIAIHKTALGAWSYDYQNGTIEIRGLKYYRYNRAGEDWTYKTKGVPSDLHAQYWLYRGGWVRRVRKIKTAIRRGVSVNEFLSIFRRDRNESDKRDFTRRDSEPLYFV